MNITHDLKLMRYNKWNYRVWVWVCQNNYGPWGVASQPLDKLSVSPHMPSGSLAVPQQDLLRPPAQWRPRRWAPCWTLCCSYRWAWCCCHCRRILSGKVGREACAKTQQQSTLYGWTDMSRGQTTTTVDSCINRHHQDEKKQKGTQRLLRQSHIQLKNSRQTCV